MKPMQILQHMTIDGPAHLATWLQEQGLRFECIRAGCLHRFRDAKLTFRDTKSACCGAQENLSSRRKRFRITKCSAKSLISNDRLHILYKTQVLRERLGFVHPLPFLIHFLCSGAR
jgi:hypothetical protein